MSELLSQDRPPPRTLGGGRYEILEQVGSGGIATVYRAHDHVLGVERAAKILSDRAGQSPVFRSRFHTEARTMARIEHPNVLRVYDFGTENGRNYLVMELVDGGSVLKLFKGSDGIPVTRALRIAFDVLKALSAVHATGAIHRDVKPGNILLAKDGTARLSDFGIVRVTNAKLLHSTNAGDAIGTVGYMAPEQRADARSVLPSSDIYAVGATLFAMVTRRHPSVLEAIGRRPEFVADVPESVVDIIRRSTAIEPDDRFATARDMAVAVVRAYDQLEPAAGELAPREHLWMSEFDRALAAAVKAMEVTSIEGPPVRLRGPQPPEPEPEEPAAPTPTPARVPSLNLAPPPPPATAAWWKILAFGTVMMGLGVFAAVAVMYLLT